MGKHWRKEYPVIAGHRACIHVLEGDRDSPAIIALHGFTGSGKDFEPLVEAAGESRYTWILPDLMGHGESEAPAHLDPFLLVPALRLIDACRALVPAGSTPHLLGYSMGGRLALQYVARARPLPATLIGASPGLEDAEAREERRYSDREWVELLNHSSMDAFCDKWEAQPLIQPQLRLREPLRSRIAERRRAGSATGLANTLLALGTGTLPSLWGRLSQLPTVHCLFGEWDAKFARIAKEMAASNPGFRVVSITGAGHAAHLENPGAMARWLDIR